MRDLKNKIEKYHLHKAHPEKLQFEVYDLNTYRKRSGDMAAVAHSHSYYQIIWFFEAGGEHIVDFTTYPIEKNTVLFISKDHIHAFDKNLEVNGYLIHFNESFFMHSDVDIFLKYNIFSAVENPCYIIDDDTAVIANSYIDLIKKELSTKGAFGYEDSIRFSLKSLLINLERVHRKSENNNIQFNSHYELQFAKYKELVEENYQKGLSVSDYSALLNISSKTLTTITKSVVGKSASGIISERIILEAKRLLRFTSLQIGEIAFRIGFDDASYFVKYFKRFVGSPPKIYREKWYQN
ncbi:helix-turn-helix domain-containing protein [Aquimarina agarivorans]|uniref:helix-turn-helix domain-containing protein n=1 Tax=Aquimarina agarivorans TaxID=980584 RepID=UPI000248FCCD|nr:AraC family transcriptional regulator [Aquimarina agarivorans]